MLVNKAEAYPSETFQPYFKDKTSVYMADSYKGTSLLQEGAFEAISHLHPKLIFMSRHTLGKHSSLTLNIRLVFTWLTATKALAYYRMVPFVAVSNLHTVLILVSKAEAYPCGTFQIRLRCNRLTITKATSLLHANFVAIRHLQPSLIFNIRLECSTMVCSSLVHKN
jgi:hypothetical protein